MQCPHQFPLFNAIKDIYQLISAASVIVFKLIYRQAYLVHVNFHLYLLVFRACAYAFSITNVIITLIFYFRFLWMVRIGGGVFPVIKEPDYLVNGDYRVDKGAAPKMLNCLM